MVWGMQHCDKGIWTLWADILDVAKFAIALYN